MTNEEEKSGNEKPEGERFVVESMEEEARNQGRSEADRGCIAEKKRRKRAREGLLVLRWRGAEVNATPLLSAWYRLGEGSSLRY